MFELNQLNQLLYVDKYGTLSKAAEELHISQSALSRSIQRLEDDLQVSLFTRQVNKMELNDNGRLAVDLAAKILEQAHSLKAQIRQFDRSQRTISVGFCAPAPLWEIPPVLADLYPEMTISSEMKDRNALLQGLRDDIFQLIVLPEKVKEDDLVCIRYGEEHLYFSLPPAHPLSSSKSLYFKDLNGETMLLRSKLGFWHDIHLDKMPDTRFLVQDEIFAFDELVKSSALPSFTSDFVMRREKTPQNRITIPIMDEEANVTYYCLYKPRHSKLLQDFFGRLEKTAAASTEKE